MIRGTFTPSNISLLHLICLAIVFIFGSDDLHDHRVWDGRKSTVRVGLSARQLGPLLPLILKRSFFFSFFSTPTSTFLACFMRGFTRSQKSNMQSLGDRQSLSEVAGTLAH